MIDINDIRQRPKIYKKSQTARGENPELVDKIIASDNTRRTSIATYENLRAEQNAIGKDVAQAQGTQKQELLTQVKTLATDVKEAQKASDETKKNTEDLIKQMPNLVADGVPPGGEDDFIVLKTVGTPRDFEAEGFKPRDHLEIAEMIGAIDMERGAKVSGSRFYFLTGVGAQLELALLTMGLNQAVAAGFTPMTTPALVRPEIMEGTGFTVSHNDEIYHIENDDLYLTGTSEVALAGYHADEILDLTKGPRRYSGWSTCFRREAGSYGKDTRGIMRVHQFNKLEMFSYAPVEEAEAEHNKLLAWEEEMLGKVELNYRVIETAAGDLGMSAARKYDSEAWIPSQKAYRELTSTSNCTTFQARRLGIRERENAEDGSKGKTTTPATLNGTLATTRWLVAILEQHQNGDGSVNVPQALQPYVGMDVLPVINPEADQKKKF